MDLINTTNNNINTITNNLRGLEVDKFYNDVLGVFPTGDVTKYREDIDIRVFKRNDAGHENDISYVSFSIHIYEAAVVERSFSKNKFVISSAIGDFDTTYKYWKYGMYEVDYIVFHWVEIPELRIQGSCYFGDETAAGAVSTDFCDKLISGIPWGTPITWECSLGNIGDYVLNGETKWANLDKDELTERYQTWRIQSRIESL